MTVQVGILLFDEVEVLDFAGPYEVFMTAARIHLRARPSDAAPFAVCTIARGGRPVRARAGLAVQPDHGFDDHPALDLLVVPGGVMTAELASPATATWIAAVSARTRITASVCTGAFLLAGAGLLDGCAVTTHWEDIEDLRQVDPGLTEQGEGRAVACHLYPAGGLP